MKRAIIGLYLFLFLVLSLQAVALVVIPHVVVISAKIDENYAQIVQRVNNIQHLVSVSQGVEVIQLKIHILAPSINPQLARDIAQVISKYSKRFGKDPDLILSIIKRESDFHPEAVSRAGAIGLMQVFPSWGTNLCKGMDLRAIDPNIKCGVMVYSYYEDTYKDRKIAITVYNRGPNPVDHLLAKGDDPVNQYSADVLETYDRLKELSQTE